MEAKLEKQKIRFKNNFAKNLIDGSQESINEEKNSSISYI